VFDTAATKRNESFYENCSGRPTGIKKIKEKIYSSRGGCRAQTSLIPDKMAHKASTSPVRKKAYMQLIPRLMSAAEWLIHSGSHSHVSTT